MKTITLETKWWLTIRGNSNDIGKALRNTKFWERFLNSRTVIDTDDQDCASAVIGIENCSELLILCSLIEPLKRLPGTLINFYCNGTSTKGGARIHLRLSTEDGNDDELVIEESILESDAANKLAKIQTVLNGE